MALDDHPALLEYRAAIAAEKELTGAQQAARNVANSLYEAVMDASQRTREAREAILAVLDENPDTYPGWAAVSTFATALPTENTTDRRTHPTPDRRRTADDPNREAVMAASERIASHLSTEEYAHHQRRTAQWPT